MRPTPHKFLAVAMLVLLPRVAVGQTAAPTSNSPPTVTLPQVDVIGTSPLLGSGIDPDQMPANVQTMGSSDISGVSQPQLTTALNQQKSSINLNAEEGSPFDPDVVYRGFFASPIFGTPQGLAVYQNGARINEAFGDTVNWDLVPNFAINRLNIISGDPAFGLNALGGAIALEMKNGFNSPGGVSEVSGGSFGQITGTAQYGYQHDGFGAYMGLSGLTDNGFRDAQQTTIRQLYTDLGVEKDLTSIHLSFGTANNILDAPGPTPVQLLDQSRSSIFTVPQSQHNQDEFLNLNGSYLPTDRLRFDSNFYFRHFAQSIVDGNTTDVQACSNPSFLCLSDPTTLLFDTSGMPIPNFLGANTPGEIDQTSTYTNGLGGSLQATLTQPIFGRPNHFVFGASIDHGDTQYHATAELGIIQSNLYVTGTGFIIDQPDGTLSPVDLDATNTYYGIYATDTFEATDKLAVTVSGRYNLASINLNDLSGTGLSGNHNYDHFNPAIGATYKVTPNITGYAGFSVANRIPTAGELACADPAHPCALAAFFVSDPNLQQVVSNSIEAGVRGHFNLDKPRGHVTWSLGLFRTDSFDDILNVASPLVSGLGFFQNAGDTRRQGVEASIAFNSARWSAYLNYSLVDATFLTSFTLSSPNNPFADADGNIQVEPGDHIPGIPENRLKVGVAYHATDKWTLGGNLEVVSSQYYQGDESNQNPTIPGYAVVNLATTYDVNDHFELFGLIDNLFNNKYANFGTLTSTGEVTPTLTIVNPESQSPGQPFSVYVGARAFF
jgi:iron complex outermembrane receptor protein